MCGSFQILGCYRGGELVAGLPFETVQIGPIRIVKNPKLTQFLGVLFHPGIQDESIRHDILKQIIQTLEKQNHRIAINCHYSVKDIRPFVWGKYRVITRFSYLVDLSNPDEFHERFESRTKYEIRKAEKNKIEIVSEDNILQFNALHRLTFERQNRKCPIPDGVVQSLYDALKERENVHLLFAKDADGCYTSSVFIMTDRNKAYYLMGANHPDFRGTGSGTLLLWETMKRLHEEGIREFDLYGANTPSISFFKRGFGGRIETYFRLEKNRLWPF